MRCACLSVMQVYEKEKKKKNKAGPRAPACFRLSAAMIHPNLPQEAGRLTIIVGIQG